VTLPTPLRIAVLVDQWPALSETFVVNEVIALARVGQDVRVESAAWAEPRAEVAEPVAVTCIDDDGLLRRALDLAWLAFRRPWWVLRDLRDRRTWQGEEVVRPLRVLAPVARRVARARSQHLHAHFAAGMALDALRIGRMLGVPYSVTAHAYDIYRSPRNLSEKLRHAAFATGESHYSVRDLRAAAGDGHAERIHVIRMGIDHRRMRRRGPVPGGRTVLAVGRLVEKKGFTHLLEAIATLRNENGIERLVIVGDGPLAAPLKEQARALGIADLVEWAGAQPASGVRAALERADVVAIPAVPVSDGDRDVLPLIAGEAMAMEVVVVASDFVGLPEVVRPPWGRLVAPGDAKAIASAIAELLSLRLEERVAAGRAGREFVLSELDPEESARRLVALMTGAQSTGVR
jgi:colanic acid/amylovoran biosynthesis glycosyltransferase